MPKEQPKRETKEVKRSQREIELEQRPMPQEGEAYPDWLKRIGGPDATIVENLEKYLFPKEKVKTPLIINKDANFILNDKNLGTYFDKEKIDAEIEKKNPNISFVEERGEYQFKKELFKNPELYFRAIGEELKEKRPIVADGRFGESLEKWKEEIKEKAEEKVEEKIEEKAEEKVEEKAEKEPKEKPKRRKKPSFAKATEGKEKKPEKEPEKKEGPLTLYEKIAQKEKELEEVEREYNIYYRPVGWFHKKPVVKDLGYYANEAQMKDLKKEIQELKKEREEIKGDEMQGKKKEEKVKEKKIAVATGGGGRIITGESKGLPEEVIEPSYEEQFEAIQERLKELPIEIRKSSVLGRSKLEKEQKKLEKKLKKLKKKK